MSTVKVEYVGSKKMKTDNVAGTGIVWYGNGDVQDVPTDAWERMAKHKDAWRAAEAAADEPEPPVEALLGTDKLPSMVDIAEGRHAQLGDIVRGAFQESGLSAADWNALDPTDRDDFILAHLDVMRAAFAAPAPAAKAKPGRKPKIKPTE